MKKNEAFDHLIGQNNTKMTDKDLKIYQRIIEAHAKEQPLEDQQSVQHISLRMEMETYLNSNSPTINHAGSFLERLLNIYNIRKSAFAEFIDLEKTNFYALLKGRRKFNNILAKKVGETFNIDPEIWMYIEAKNELKSFNALSKLDSEKYSLQNLLNRG